jgi:hypothetical protein
MPFHISPETGNPNACKAKPGNCPFGSVNEHYGSKDEARDAYEKSQELFQAAQLIKLDSEGYLASKYVNRIPLHGLSCPACGEAYTAAGMQAGEDDAAVCSKGHSTFIDELEVKMTPENPSAKFMDKQAVKDAVWYHSTLDPNWLASFDEEDDASVHLGVEDASFDRALSDYAGSKWDNSRYSEGAKDFYLYEVKIDDDASVADELSKSNYTVDRELDEKMEDELPVKDVTRYFNTVEGPGSISLVANAKKLKIVGFRKVTAAEAQRRLSVQNINPAQRNVPNEEY